MQPEPYRTRFAPSPTGPLHLGHAYSALTAWRRAHDQGGTFLLRIEDIDQPRCRAEYEIGIFADLRWLGLQWPEPVMRQSDRLPAYRNALDRLAAKGLTYPCRCTRADIREALSAPQEGTAASGPDGPVYPGSCRSRAITEAGPQDSIRLNMARARALIGVPLRGYRETGPLRPGYHRIEPDQLLTATGDIVLARRDIGTSYHLAVVVDDAAQGITEVVRGADLETATPVQVLLQLLLELPTPSYYHHDLIRDEEGRRLAKRDDSRALRLYRDAGASPADIARKVGLVPRAVE